MNDERKSYVKFSRDMWGIARRGATLYLTERQYEDKNDLLRQVKAGWLVPESEASEVR